MEVKIKLLEGGKTPEFKHSDDACADCCARISGTLTGTVVIPKGERMVIPLGFAVALDNGFEAQIRARSGLTASGIDAGFGTVDSGYRGEVKACLINNSDSDFLVNNGDRICQIAFRKSPGVIFKVVDELPDSKRGINGFGSTGMK